MPSMRQRRRYSCAICRALTWARQVGPQPDRASRRPRSGVSSVSSMHRQGRRSLRAQSPARGPRRFRCGHRRATRPGWPGEDGWRARARRSWPPLSPSPAAACGCRTAGRRSRAALAGRPPARGGQRAFALVGVLARDHVGDQPAVGIVHHRSTAPAKPPHDARAARQALLAAGQVIAIEHAQLLARQSRGDGSMRAITAQPLGATAHQRPQDARLGVVDLVVERRQRHRQGAPSGRAAACSDGRRPRETSVISSITVENSSSREYCRWRWPRTPCQSTRAETHGPVPSAPSRSPVHAAQTEPKQPAIPIQTLLMLPSSLRVGETASP